MLCTALVAMMRAVLLALALLAWTTGARDDFRPCARVVSVTGGEAGFSVQVAFERVRAFRCVMRIPITHVPEMGTRYGIRAGLVCENDGLGCIELEEPTYVLVDSDLPRYERPLVPNSVLPSFDKNPRDVPFMHLAGQLSDPIGSRVLPYGTWILQLFGLNLQELSGRSLAYMSGTIHDMLIALVSPNSPLLENVDASIAPQMWVTPTSMVPNFSPIEASDFVMRGARAFSSSDAGQRIHHNIPWVNITYVMKYPFRALSPTFRELLASDTAAVSLVERIMRLGLDDVQAFELLQTYNFTLQGFLQQPEVLFGGIPAQQAINDSDTTLLFPQPNMTMRLPSGAMAGCLTRDDWYAVIGSVNSSWADQECNNSTQCGMVGIGYDKMSLRVRRSVPYHLSANSPTCMTLQPTMIVKEQATLRLGASVVVDNATVAQVVTTVTLLPEEEIQWAFEDPDAEASFGIAVTTDEDSVPRLITEPVEAVYAMNCFAHRTNIPVTVDDENPYIDEPPFTAPSVVERQRGTMILDARQSDSWLGSGCGSMNFGQAFWRQLINHVPGANFSSDLAGPDILNGTHPTLHDKIGHAIGTLYTAFQQTGSSCISGSRCNLPSPCSLIREEMQWMRYHGRLPPRVPAFDPDAPALQPNPEFPAWPDSSLQQPSKPIVDVFANHPGLRRSVQSFGCLPSGGGIPTSLTAHFWNPHRMNMWVGSNRMGSGAGSKLHIEDTFPRHNRRISRGVSFGMSVEVPWSHVPHRHVTTNATGCVYFPIITLTASPDLTCRDVEPAVAGTAFAHVPDSDLGSSGAELILVIECVGASFCPVWNASLATLVDAVTNEPVEANVTTTQSLVDPNQLRYLETRFRNDSSPGDAFSDGLSFDELKDFTGLGPVIAHQIVFRFTQNETERKYVWEVHGTGNVSSAYPNYFSREYLAQLFIGSTGVAVSGVAAKRCHSLVDCQLNPQIPPDCTPPTFGFNTRLIIQNVTYYDPCDCGFFDVACQRNCGMVMLWWYIFALAEILVVSAAGIFFLYKTR